MKEVVIVSATRRPSASSRAASPGSALPNRGLAIAEAIQRAGIEASDVEEVIFGNVLQAGLGQNPPDRRRAAGVPDEVGSVTINKVCGSGLKSVMLAAQAIRAGDADCVVAGGMESMSNAPYLMPDARSGMRLGHSQVLDSMVHDGLWDIYNDYMGMTVGSAPPDRRVPRRTGRVRRPGAIRRPSPRATPAASTRSDSGSRSSRARATPSPSPRTRRFARG